MREFAPNECKANASEYENRGIHSTPESNQCRITNPFDINANQCRKSDKTEGASEFPAHLPLDSPPISLPFDSPSITWANNHGKLLEMFVRNRSEKLLRLIDVRGCDGPKRWRWWRQWWWRWWLRWLRWSWCLWRWWWWCWWWKNLGCEDEGTTSGLCL